MIIRVGCTLVVTAFVAVGIWVSDARAAEPIAAEPIAAAPSAALAPLEPAPVAPGSPGAAQVEAAIARQLQGLEFAASAGASPMTLRETPALRPAATPWMSAPRVGVTQRRAGALFLGAGLFALAGAGALAISVAGNRDNESLYCAGDPQCTDALGLLARSRANDGALVGYLLASDRKSTRLNSSHPSISRMPSSA